MSNGERSELPPRVADMVERFCVISETNMRGTPVYNDKLGVEAIGFHELKDDLCGILITPWFMNVVLLPREKISINYSLIASPTDEVLPSGAWQFMYGGDDVIGLYKSLSLHSPMFAFKNQTHAQIEAERRLHSLFTAPACQLTDKPATGASPRNPERRYILHRHATG